MQTTNTKTRYHYYGVNKTGTHTVGTVVLADDELAGWVQTRFDGRWRELDVVNTAGEQVAAILRDDYGRRGRST